MKTLLKSGQEFDFYVKREYSLFQLLSFIPCYAGLPELVIGSQTAARCEIKNKWGNIYIIRKDMDAVLNYYIQLIMKGASFLEEEIKILDQTGRRWVAETESIVKTSQEESANLQDLLKSFWNLLNDHTLSLWKTFIISDVGGSVFTKLFTKYVPPELHSQAVVNYSRPSKKAHLLRLAETLSQTDDLNERVQYIKENYPWIFTTDLFSPLPREEQYVEYAKTFKKLEHTKEGLKDLFPDEVIPIIKTCQEISYLKDHRDEYRRRAFFGIQPLVERIKEQYKITRDDLWHIFPDELSTFETDRDGILRDVAERKMGLIFEVDNNRTLYLQGKEAVENFIQEEQVIHVNEIKGIVGAPGKVSGEVQIIARSEDLKNFKEGNILVAITTNPDYISAMQKAKAFITDEGGIICHAAIVARELKKPCIVGAKIATKILKDGDKVEVDANTGVIKIIK